ncbi:MAG: GGDEF domain-containing protein [Saccharofermentans sp.]|nr:GGDEF domain-containing protein [Saccharofermentans sp.]
MRYCMFIGDMYREFALEIIKYTNSFAKEHGHRVDVFGMCSMPTTNPLHVIGYKSVLKLPDTHQYDGIILCYDTLIHEAIGKEVVEQLLEDMEGPPVACIRAQIPGFFNIIPDNKALMYDIAKYVISKCKTGNIGFIMGRDDLEDAHERREGFEQAMHEAGYEVSEDMVFHGNYWYDQGVEQVDFFTKEDGSIPEAIICSNDYAAVGVSDELRNRGYSIPDDIIVSGMDNISEASDHIPPITTIQIKNRDFVKAAFDVLEAESTKDKNEYNIYVTGTLIPRDSTGDSVTERDIFTELCDLKVATQASANDMRQFVLMNDLFEAALTMEALVGEALNQFKSIKSVKSCFICRYLENDRELVGYFNDRGENHASHKHFLNTMLLPDSVDENETDTHIHFALAYKNEVYGYVVLIVDTNIPEYINFKTEYILTQLGQNINKLELYERLAGVSDVMDLFNKDPLTEILNRRGFEQRISQMFDKDGNRKMNMAIVSLDMDRLKFINDNFGHAAGDDAIKETSECVSKALNPDEFVARMGGDEFAAVLILSEVGRLGRFIRSVRSNFKEINESGKYEFELSCSIGTCELNNWHGVMDCMSKADKAMYLEKKAKKAARQD